MLEFCNFVTREFFVKSFGFQTLQTHLKTTLNALENNPRRPKHPRTLSKRLKALKQHSKLPKSDASVLSAHRCGREARQHPLGQTLQPTSIQSYARQKIERDEGF